MNFLETSLIDAERRSKADNEHDQCTHVTPILASHYKILIKFRIQFKILLLTYKAPQGQTPAYLYIRGTETVSLQPTSHIVGSRGLNCSMLLL